MNTKTLLAIASVAAFSGLAHAGEADQFVGRDAFQGSRVRAEVRAEAAQAAKNARLGEVDVSGFSANASATRDTQAVKAEAVQAARVARLGEVSTL